MAFPEYWRPGQLSGPRVTNQKKKVGTALTEGISPILDDPFVERGAKSAKRWAGRRLPRWSRSEGVRGSRVLDSMRKTPRHRVVPLFPDQFIEWSDAVLKNTAAEDFGLADIPGRDIRPRPPLACTRSRAGLFFLGRAEGKDGVGDGLECWSFRRRRAQNPWAPGVVLARGLGRDRGGGRPFPQTTDRAEKSRFDTAKDEWHLS